MVQTVYWTDLPGLICFIFTLYEKSVQKPMLYIIFRYFYYQVENIVRTSKTVTIRCSLIVINIKILYYSEVFPTGYEFIFGLRQRHLRVKTTLCSQVTLGLMK